jgi:hypothetical protein
VKYKKKIVRNFLFKNRRIKVADVSFEDGDGAYHVWVGRKLVSCFGFGTVQEAVNEGKFEINNSKYRRK